MKLLSTPAQWQKWLLDEVGRFSGKDYPAPQQYPCYAYMELESWGQETLRAIYLYQKDLEEMATNLVFASQRM